MENLKKFLPLTLLCSLMLSATFLVDKKTIIESKEQIAMFTQNNLILSATLYTVAYASCVGLSLPIATVLTLLAGIIFGPILGTAIVVIGATIGAIIIFQIIKTSSKHLNLLIKPNKSKYLPTLQSNLQENAVSYLLFARLVPIFPFVLVNIAPATVGVKLSTFAWTTLIGIIPGSFIYTNLGYQSGQINNIEDLISVEMLLALTLLGMFSLTPLLIKKIKKDKK